MKIFRRRQLFTVFIVFIGCILVSNLIFDRISNGQPYSGSVQKCANINQLFSPNGPRCQNSTYTFKNFGWPFVSIRRSDAISHDNEFRVHSFAIDKRQSVYISLNTILLFLVAIATYIFLRRYILGRFESTNPFDAPLIESSDMLDEAGLTSLVQGKIAGYPYNLLTNSKGRLMLNVTLSNDTGIHVVATGSESISSLPFSEQIESRFLKPVVLEGDFPEHFKLYCTPGKQIELLQIFEPATMVRLIDFCKAYQFEIFHDTLYIAQAYNANDAQDQTTMMSDAETLLMKSGRTFDRLKA